jgi:hypothetical protein
MLPDQTPRSKLSRHEVNVILSQQAAQNHRSSGQSGMEASDRLLRIRPAIRFSNQSRESSHPFLIHRLPAAKRRKFLFDKNSV